MLLPRLDASTLALPFSCFTVTASVSFSPSFKPVTLLLLTLTSPPEMVVVPFAARSILAPVVVPSVVVWLLIEVIPLRSLFSLISSLDAWVWFPSLSSAAGVETTPMFPSVKLASVLAPPTTLIVVLSFVRVFLEPSGTVPATSPAKVMPSSKLAIYFGSLVVPTYSRRSFRLSAASVALCKYV